MPSSLPGVITPPRTGVPASLRRPAVAAALLIAAAAGCERPPHNGTALPHRQIDFSDGTRAVLLVASSPAAACPRALASELHLYRSDDASAEVPSRWVGGLSLNADHFRSDFADRFGFVQAFQVPPGNYRFELRRSGSGPAVDRRPRMRPALQLAAGDIRFFGAIESSGCGSSTSLQLSRDWPPLAAAFEQHFKGLPASRVKLPAATVDFGIER